MRWLAGATFAVAVGGGFLGCGGGSHLTSRAGDRVVARVGSETITQVTLRHWMGILSPTHQVPDPPRYKRCVQLEQRQGSPANEAGRRRDCEEEYLALRKRTLGFLITLSWVKGTAASKDHGAPPANGRVAQATAMQTGVALAGGGPDDIRLLEQAEAAIAWLRAGVVHRTKEITANQVGRVYARNIRSREHREKRSFNIVEQLSGPSEARKLMATLRRLGKGIGSLIAHQKPGPPVAIHEIRERPPHLRTQPVVWRAIFSAQPRVLVGPVPLFEHYAILEVLHVVAAHRPSFADMTKTIKSRLKAAHETRALNDFARTWRTQWIRRTQCAPDVVIEQCRDYRGTPASEYPSTARVIVEGIRRAYSR